MNTGTECLSGVPPTCWRCLLPWMLCGCLCLGPIARTQTSESVASPATASVSLEYRESESDLVHVGLSIDPQSQAFAGEPSLSGRNVRRGVLSVGPEHKLPFIWDQGNGQLYLDLNRNDDLSDDSEGRFTCTDRPGSGNYQVFENVRFELPIHGMPQRMRFNLNLYYFGQLNGSIALRSYWSGKALLQNREWELGVVPLAHGQRREVGNEIMLLRPWNALGSEFSVGDGSLDTFACGSALFFLGQAYEVERKVSAGTPLRFEMTLTPREIPLGEVRFTGQHLQRALLTEGPWTVVLEEPAGTVAVPYGTYASSVVYVRKGESAARLQQTGVFPTGVRHPIVVEPGTPPAVVTTGGPLTNSVVVQRHGQSLVLGYQLIGAAGEAYRPLSLAGEPPRFAIYHGERLLESGNFEFG
ncbi:MAG: hypothetical protein KJ072_00750 [Verrucomicrobia bacterium]|nr:hypothetical protein [Verrucomicrobiota bacterium]